MADETEDLKSQWEGIERRNVENHNRKLKKTKVASVVILAAMIVINGLFSLSMFAQNHPIIGMIAAAFGLFISGLYFIQSVKPSFKEPERVYNPESNPIA